MRGVLDFLLPSHCVLCQERAFGYNLCATCESQIRFITPPYIDDENSKYIRKNRSLAYYEGNWRRLIQYYKFHKKLFLTRDFLRLIKLNFLDIQFSSYDYIICVPSSFDRLSERGFNQAEYLAKKLAHTWRRRFVDGALVKKEHIAAQNTLSMSERMQSVKGAFSLNPKYCSTFKDKKLLVVDDVRTTGATLKECAKSLSVARPHFIDSLTLAYTPLH